MDAHDVRPLQQRVDRDHRHGGIRDRRPVEGDGLETHAVREARHLAADAAQAHDAQRLSLELHALHRPPPAAANDAVHGRDVPRGGKDEAHSVLGDSRVAVAADGRDLDAETGGGSKVDETGGAGAEENDVLQSGAELQDALAEIGRIVDHRVVALDRPWNVGFGNGPGVDRDRNIIGSVNHSPQTIDIRGRINEDRLGHRHGPLGRSRIVA